jgi:hypothetical protein
MRREEEHKTKQTHSVPTLPPFPNIHKTPANTFISFDDINLLYYTHITRVFCKAVITQKNRT